MNKKYILVLLTILLALAPLAAYAAEAEEQRSMTRGEYFLYIAQHLSLEAAGEDFIFPQDVDVDSEYAWALQALMEAGIVHGHQDGTARLNDPIIREHAYIILERVLGYHEPTLLEAGKSLLDAEVITAELAQAAVTAVIARDDSALEWLAKSSEAMLKQTSYNMSAEMILEMIYTPAVAQMLGLDGQSIGMGMSLDSNFHLESGIAQTIQMTMVELAEMEDALDGIVQYIVPEGTFMKMGDAWINLSDELPFSFEELVQQQLEGQIPMDLYTSGNMFIKDLGEEELDGQKVQAIQVYGKLSLEDIVLLNQQMLQSDEMATLLLETSAELEMIMYLNAVNYIDVETGLIVKSVQQITLEYVDNAEMEGMHLIMTISFTDFNKVEPFTLPEEAKGALTMEEFMLQLAELEGME